MRPKTTVEQALNLLREATELDVVSLREGLEIESYVQDGIAAPVEVVQLIDEVAACDCCTLCEKKCKGYKKAPVGSPRQRSFCRRMCGHRKKNTGSKTAKDKDSCINQALRRWKCRCS